MIGSLDTRTGALNDGLDRIAFSCLYALVFVIPWEEVVPLLGGISIIRWVGLLAFGTACLRTLACGRARKPYPLHYMMMALICWSGVSILWSVVPDVTASLTGTYLQLIVLVWLVWELAYTEDRVSALLQAYVLGTVVSSIETIRNAVYGRTAGDVYLEDYGVNTGQWSGSRYSAGTFNLNDLGLLLALSIPMSIYLISCRKNSIFHSVYWVHLALCATAVILTASRGSAIALAVAFLIVPLTITYWSKWQRYASIAILAAGVGFAAYTIPDAVWNRLLEIGDEFQRGTLSQRTTIWSASTEVFRNHPFAGVGAGGFREAVKGVENQVAHNTFVSVFVELGVIGGFILAASLLAMFYCAFTLPPLGQRLWIVMLVTWMVGVSALTWEYRKTTWCIFGLVAAHAGARRAKRILPRSSPIPVGAHTSNFGKGHSLNSGAEL